MIKQNILVTTDSIIFAIHKDSLKVMLIKRLIEPFKDMWAIPGGFVLDDENLDTAAYRELKEETNVENTYLEQLYTFSDVNRDPRGRVLSCAYMALMKYSDIKIKAGSDAKEVKLWDIKKLPKLAFDHGEILQYAIKRLKYKVEYTNAIQYLLDENFTISELHKAYEIILDKEIDIRNFSKKVFKLGVIQETGEKVIRGAHRPAMLYRFVYKDLVIVEMV